MPDMPRETQWWSRMRKGIIVGNEVKVIFREQVVRYEGGNREAGWDASPIIPVCDDGS